MQITSIKFKGSANDPVSTMVEEKHQEYLAKAKRYKILYYVTRLTAGLSAGLLPFTLQYIDSTSSLLRQLPTALSVVVVVATVFDFVFSPKEKWALFSKATDLLAIAKIRAMGHYEQHAETLDLILNTESAALQQVMNLNDLVNKIEATHQQSAR